VRGPNGERRRKKKTAQKADAQARSPQRAVPAGLGGSRCCAAQDRGIHGFASIRGGVLKAPNSRGAHPRAKEREKETVAQFVHIPRRPIKKSQVESVEAGEHRAGSSAIEPSITGDTSAKGKTATLGRSCWRRIPSFFPRPGESRCGSSPRTSRRAENLSTLGRILKAPRPRALRQCRAARRGRR